MSCFRVKIVITIYFFWILYNSKNFRIQTKVYKHVGGTKERRNQSVQAKGATDGGLKREANPFFCPWLYNTCPRIAPPPLAADFLVTTSPKNKFWSKLLYTDVRSNRDCKLNRGLNRTVRQFWELKTHYSGFVR